MVQPGLAVAPRRTPPVAPAGRAARELPLVLILVALSLWVYRSALGAFFSPDDLIYLERVRGIVPEPPTLWRFLSGPAYFRLAHAAFGAHAFPYLLVNWLLHGLCVAALYAWVRGAGGGVLAAGLAAGLFGTSRLFLTVVLQVVTVAEPLSLLLALGALGMAVKPGAAWRLGAALVFAAALLCKETVMLLPLLLLLPGPEAAPLSARASRYAVLMAPTVLLLAYLSSPVVQAGLFVNDIYARAYGVNLFHNLMTMTGWATDFRTPIPDLYSTLSTAAWRTGLWVTLGFAALAVVAWRATRLPAFGLGWWLLALAPVLPLLRQRYLHYLYVPVAGLTLAVGAGWEWAVAGARAAGAAVEPTAKRAAPAGGSRATAGRSGVRAVFGWAVAVAAILGQVVVSDALIHERAAKRLPTVDLPYDPFLRKQETARRVITRVGGATAGRRVSAVLVVPEQGWTAGLAQILHSVLGEGRALRAVLPNLDSVALVPRWSTAYRDFELFYGRVDGNVVDLGRGPDAHRRLVEALIADDCLPDAGQELATALAAYPDDPGLAALRDRLAAAARRPPPAATRP